jgi:flavorubredoxin
MNPTAIAPVPATRAHPIAPDTWLIPNLAPAGDGLYLPVNSMVIRGRQPVIVDTGAPVHRKQWLDKAFAVVEPEDVRWIFLSHDDGDHTGALLDVLERCPKATLVTNFFSVERLALEKPALPLHRMRWIEAGGTLDVGDRVLQLFRPPIFDGPTTRGLFDPKSEAMWIVDTFACLTPEPLDAEDLASEALAQMSAMNSAVSPWHAWLDRATWWRHIDAVEAFGARTVASAHGPVLRGEQLGDAFDRLRGLAGAPIIPMPGQELLDSLLAPTLQEAIA